MEKVGMIGGSVARARAAAAIALLLLAMASACSDATSGANTAPPGSPTVSESTPSESTSSDPSPDPTPDPSLIVDPEHAVEAPGPFNGRLYAADILVYGKDSMSPSTVAEIRRLRGVQHVDSLSLAEVVIENQALTVAAVDADSYRHFAHNRSANTDEVWDRVAGGEVAVLRGLRDKLPLDAGGFLKMGSSADVPWVHVGAYAPQVYNAIDAVVNEKWGSELGLKSANALLISTGDRSPQSLRKSIEKIAGDDASVQLLDAVARFGLDTSVQQTAFVTGSVADAVGTFNYTVLGGGRIAPDPSWEAAHIATETVPILGSVRCNKALFPQLRAALREIEREGLANEIHPDEYAGCYYPRFIAGTTTLSNHSFGLALDLNVPGNQRGTVGEMDRTVVSIFQKWGFTWGGDWRYTDPMHFEMNSIVAPG